MTRIRCIEVAYLRGIYFSGKRKWLNSTIGYGYEFLSPDRRICQADTLNGAYKMIMSYPRTK